MQYTQFQSREVPIQTTGFERGLVRVRGRALFSPAAFLLYCIYCICMVGAVGCGGNSSLPYPGTGLTLQEPSGDLSVRNNPSSSGPPGRELVWELTVGVLNARGFPRLDRKQAETLLESARRRLTRQLPGLSVRFILDQPLDAPFMLERLIRKKDRLSARYRASEPVLLLDGGDVSGDLNRKKVRLASAGKSPMPRAAIEALLNQMAHLRKIRLTAPGSGGGNSRSGEPLLTDRLSASDLVWREFLRQQVRYDLVLTNALIFPDDLRLPADFRDGKGGGIRMRIARAEGRTGMEGMAAYISTFRLSSYDVSGPTAAVESDLNAVLLALLLPARLKGMAGRKSTSGAGILNCSGCPRVWRRRLAYLRGTARINRADIKNACRLLMKNRPSYKGAPALLRPEKERRELAIRNHELLIRKCPR